MKKQIKLFSAIVCFVFVLIANLFAQTQVYAVDWSNMSMTFTFDASNFNGEIVDFDVYLICDDYLNSKNIDQNSKSFVKELENSGSISKTGTIKCSHCGDSPMYVTITKTSTKITVTITGDFNDHTPYAKLKIKPTKGYGQTKGAVYGSSIKFTEKVSTKNAEFYDSWNYTYSSGNYVFAYFDMGAYGGGWLTHKNKYPDAVTEREELYGRYNSSGVGKSTIKLTNEENICSIKYVGTNADNPDAMDSSSGKTYSISTLETKATAINKYTRTGYTFSGWKVTYNYDSDWSITLANKGYIWNTSKDTPYYYEHGGVYTLTPIWTPISYTIKYNLNGGTVSGNPTSYTIATATFTLKNPTKTGYTFLGWTGSNGTTAQTTVKIAKGSTGNKAYTANWKANAYTLSFNGNKPSAAISSVQNVPASKTITYDGIVAKVGVPTLAGWIFEGWTDSNGLLVFDENGYPTNSIKNIYMLFSSAGITWKCTSNLTVYAKWVQDDSQSSLSLNVNNSTTVNDNNHTSYAKIEKGQSIVSATDEKWYPNLYFAANASDTGVGVHSIHIISGSGKNDKTQKASTTQQSLSTSVYTAKEGTDTIYARAITGSGTRLTTEAITIKTDSTAPVIDSFYVKQSGLDAEAIINRANSISSNKSQVSALSDSSLALLSPTVTFSIDDSNINALNGSSDVSKIKKIYFVIYDTQRPSYKITETYFESEKDSENKVSVVALDHRFDVFDKFAANEPLQLAYELHVVDGAGNETIQTKTVTIGISVAAGVTRITQTDDNQNNSYFMAGSNGILHIVTTGWVDKCKLAWPDSIIKAMDADVASNTGKAYLDYNISFPMDIGSIVQNNKPVVYSLDPYGYTRCYDFHFWIPWSFNSVNGYAKDENGKYPVVPIDVIIDTTREKRTNSNVTIARAQAKASVKIEINGYIADYIRSVLVLPETK